MGLAAQEDQVVVEPADGGDSSISGMRSSCLSTMAELFALTLSPQYARTAACSRRRPSRTPYPATTPARSKRAMRATTVVRATKLARQRRSRLTCIGLQQAQQMAIGVVKHDVGECRRPRCPCRYALPRLRQLGALQATCPTAQRSAPHVASRVRYRRTALALDAAHGACDQRAGMPISAARSRSRCTTDSRSSASSRFLRRKAAHCVRLTASVAKASLRPIGKSAGGVV